MTSNPKLVTLFNKILDLYVNLISRINATEKMVVWKLFDGHYHCLENDGEYRARIKEVKAAIDAAKERDGNFNVNGKVKSVSMTWNTFEDLLFLQCPNIYLFNEKFSLRELLPERIDTNWEKGNNKFLNAFVEYLGKEIVDRYLVSNDPEEREELLAKLRTRVKALTDKVNQYRTG